MDLLRELSWARVGQGRGCTLLDDLHPILMFNNRMHLPPAYPVLVHRPPLISWYQYMDHCLDVHKPCSMRFDWVQALAVVLYAESLVPPQPSYMTLQF